MIESRHMHKRYDTYLSIVFLCILVHHGPFLHFVNAGEKVAPGCSQSRANICEKEKSYCEKHNNSIHENFCQCAENFQSCLMKIDPKACMRGKHCVLSNHRCVNFNCAFDKKRCEPCYKKTEYDMSTPAAETFLESIVHHASYSVPLMIGFIFGVYAYFGCLYNVKLRGKKWGCDACPHRNFWKLFCCCFFPDKKKKKKKKKEIKNKLKKKKIIIKSKDVNIVAENYKKKGPSSRKKKPTRSTSVDDDEIEIEIEIPAIGDDHDDVDDDENEKSSFLH